MVQREVAERIAAPPGRMSYLSVFVQYHARVRIALPRARRRPSSRSRRSSRRSSSSSRTPRTTASSRRAEDELWRLVQAALPRAAQDDPQRPDPAAAARAGRVTAALAAAGIDPDRRPQTLAVGEWLALREALGADRARRAAAGATPVVTGSAQAPATRWPALAGRPACPGQAQPDARRHRASRRRLSHPPFGVRAAWRSPTG